jgi:hypothetical protein
MRTRWSRWSTLTVIVPLCLLVVTVTSWGDSADPVRVTGSLDQALPFNPNEVLDKDQNGDWKVSWSTVLNHAATLPFDATTGEPWHRLHPEPDPKRPVFVGIRPVRDIWNVPLEDLRKGRIVAVVYSTGRSAPQSLFPGENFLLVWWRNNAPKMVVLNRIGRQEVGTFEVAEHGGMQPPVPGLQNPPPRTPQRMDTLKAANIKLPESGSPAMLRCINHGWKACFIDDPQQQRAPFPRDPLGDGAMGLGIAEPRQIFNSQPWVSCLLYGCCCGGMQCH